MEAPVIGPANMASRATTPPIANAAVTPSSFAPVVTLKMVIIKINVKSINSWLGVIIR